MKRTLPLVVVSFVMGTILGPIVVWVLLIGLFSENAYNTFADVGDYGRYVFCGAEVAERMKLIPFEPHVFSMAETQTVYRLKFRPKFPRTHKILIRYPYGKDGLYGEQYRRHHPLSARVTIRHGGIVYRQLEIQEALVRAYESSRSLEWVIADFDPSLFPWRYGESILLEVELLSPVDAPYESEQNGLLEVRSVLPLS